MRPVLAVILLAITSFVSVAKNPVKTTARDRKILESVLDKLESEKNKSTAQLVVLAGMQFLGTSYVAATLEGETEELVINLREMDCTTFAEYCLAIARTVKSDAPGFDTFADQLQKIRYRDGKIDGYISRLHYFSDWIWDNAEKGIVEIDTGEICSEVFPGAVNFMSMHPEGYQLLKDNPELIEAMKKIEASIGSRKMFYIPKDKVHELEVLLKPGDIVGITTSIAGLDMSHVGILVRQNGRIHLLHASSSAKKVVVSDQTLEDYLEAGSKTSGIMLARPL